MGTTSHFTESNAGHMSVQTTSPFLNKIKDSEYKVTEQNQCISKKNHSTSIINKKLPKDVSSGTSKLLINQILGDSIDNEMIINLNKSYTEKTLNIEKQSNYYQSFLINNVRFKYSTPTFNSKSFSMQRGSCSREDSIGPSGTVEDNRNENNTTYSKQALNIKKFAEKTTYCRPSISYNQEFINKTVERNNRLQRLVKKLILIRKKEKQTEAWNNYINELKSKHKHYATELNRIIGRHTLEEPTPLEYIDDYYDNQSNLCKDLLQDFYDAYDTIQYNSNSYEINPQDIQTNKSPRPNYRSYFNNSNCYPMSSQGRLMMLNRERQRNSLTSDWPHHPARRPPNCIYVDKESTRENNCRSNKVQSRQNIVGSKRCYCAEKNCAVKHSAVQTDCCLEAASASTSMDIKQEGTNTEDERETAKDAYTRVSENVEILKRRIQETCSFDRPPLLESIENKIDNLISSINSFIDDVKSRAYVRQCYGCHSVCLDRSEPYSNKMNDTRSETFVIKRAEELVCGIIEKDPDTPSTSGLDRKLIERSRGTNIDRILMEEINSSNRAKEDIENMLSESVGCPCSVSISIDIPTRDRSTEVTESLEKAESKAEDNPSVSIQEVDRSVGEGDAPQMTIAVNTDPLGLLALLRVSKETMMQLLSYVPNIPYNSYLPMINIPQTREVPHFICNICGAAFARPSQLSDHIERHDLTKTRLLSKYISSYDFDDQITDTKVFFGFRDCCVCRHILDMQRHRPPGLFRCRYCGQRFARAYCCELHQEACARRLGRRHDVSPSLMLLR